MMEMEKLRRLANNRHEDDRLQKSQRIASVERGFAQGAGANGTVQHGLDGQGPRPEDGPTMRVGSLQAGEGPRWDRYVHASGSTTFFQLVAWQQILESIFGLETHYLYAERGGNVVGVLPLYRVHNPIFGHYFSSLPGSLCADESEAAGALVARARALVEERRANYLILRDGRQNWSLPGLQVDTSHCTLVAHLPPDVEQLWAGIRSEDRRAIRQATKKGITVETSPHRLEAFYPHYLRAMRARGTPPYTLDFFRALRETFPSNFDLQVVSIDDEIFAGGLIAPFRNTVLCTWAAISATHYHLRPSHLLLWKTIEYASDHGYSQVDFGRSQLGSGSCTFKQRWGAEPVPLYQHYYLNGASAPPAVGNGYQDDRRFRFFTTLWRRMPLSMTRVVGARVRRHVPFG